MEREYSKYLVKFVKENMKIVEQFIPQMEELLLIYGLNMDAESPALTQLDILLDRIHMAMKNPSQMLPVINSMAIKVDRYNRLELEAITKSVLGVPLREIPFDRIMKQDATADDTLREMWVAENLDYLKNVDEQTMQKIKLMLTGKITGTVNRRELTRDLVKEIEDITGFEKNRAILIARDQVGKLNGQLTEYRQRHAGITQYKWSTSKDSRVRPAHKELEGKIFDWDNPPPEGNPGMPIRCRCVAIPVIDLDKIVTQPVKGSYKGLSSGKVTSADEDKTTIVETMPIDFNDDKAVQAMFKQFTDNVVANAKKEYAIVVSKSNRSFWLEGGNSTVDITRAGKELYGAKVIHNHPDYLGLPADSFSIDDVEYLIEYNLEYLEVATNLGRFRVRYVGKPITVQDMYLAYKEAYNQVMNRCRVSHTVSEYNQLDTMRQLPKVLEGVIFEEL
ncbi:phage putative head morphogenesis protein, SPP1 gp7 family [Anaerovibrio lipolyticus DSM 3074]|uniref:Phage putative head morphogenesis protein, SPP1 gp7 family n=1 Tax=Anaerovibrio lipolyticus DSM 3074 TaxID=1120997 RepID=A0A1M6CMA6_9FIRM|nr:phage putative head morphogenesis protein, SPP1 gp7 family [Anaerovibrio lipolyticus DSM 3074]